MKEWQKKNEFNSFNSWKGLLYSRWYSRIRDWKDCKVKAPYPPVEVSLDPIHACNLQCSHCNASKYLQKELKGRRIPNDHLENLIKFFGKWGVKAVCFGGGGEPTLHSNLSNSLYLTHKLGIEASIATNGTLFNNKLIKAMSKTCRWVGVSIDSATAKTYKIGRKQDLFNTAISNIKLLTKEIKSTNSKCEVAFKFLIFDYNQHEIYDACKLAKQLGVRDFHVRPADFTHQGMGEGKKEKNPYDKKLIEKQFEECHKLETDEFRIFTILHKFDNELKPRKDFSQCYASPCCLQLCADGNAYLCPDQRHQEFYKLGNHYPIPENILNFWGGKKHYDLVFNKGKNNCKTRCTFQPYNKQCQELFIENKDPMCKWFI